MVTHCTTMFFLFCFVFAVDNMKLFTLNTSCFLTSTNVNFFYDFEQKNLHRIMSDFQIGPKFDNIYHRDTIFMNKNGLYFNPNVIGTLFLTRYFNC